MKTGVSTLARPTLKTKDFLLAERKFLPMKTKGLSSPGFRRASREAFLAEGVGEHGEQAAIR
jgi:hypothetical protein